MKAVRVWGLISAMATAGALAACSTEQPEEQQSPGVQLLRAEGVQRAAPAADAPVDDAVNGLRDFADKFGEATAKPGENAVFSPLSMASAFAMLRAGADGETAKELDALFGFPEPGVHPAYNSLTSDIVTKGGDGPQVNVANGLFLAKGLKAGDEFLTTLAEQYGAGAQSVDFKAPAAKDTVNQWVGEQTAGRIPKVLDELDPQTRFVLANAVYLKADWETKFSPELTTEEADFHRADGTTSTVAMMHRESDLSYVSGEGWQAAALPYAGGELAMWVVVPGGEPTESPRITADMLDAFASGEQRKVKLSMPRWDFGTGVDLLDELAKLGLSNLGDLDPLTPGAAVTAAVHKANITVGEDGTEAAAATVIGDAGSAPQQDKPLELTADRPFAFAITHLETGAPLFVGTVADPATS